MAGRSLGPRTDQLNGPLVYASTGRYVTSQLATVEHIGVFDAPLPGPPDELPRMPGADWRVPLDRRARAYLQTNCAHCHAPEGPTPAFMDLRIDATLDELGLCDEIPTQGDLGIENARLMAPGDPARSILSVRMHALDGERMPPLGTEVVDETGSALIDEWIESWPSCAGPDGDGDSWIDDDDNDGDIDHPEDADCPSPEHRVEGAGCGLGPELPGILLALLARRGTARRSRRGGRRSGGSL